MPSLLGLDEFDAFLLVVDGVPWGGAGSVPVTYGATAFIGGLSRLG
ncbi:hypothetical protein [Lichenicoccus sp.]